MPRRGLSVLLILLASMPAAAQDVGASLPAVAPAAPEQSPVSLAERFVWERRAGLGERVADVDVQPIVAGAWIAVDERGGVWLSEDEGGRWDNVVRPIGGLDDDELPDDEELLLEAETRQAEALEDAAEEFEPTEPDADVPTTDEEPVEVELPEAPERDDDAVADEAELLAQEALERSGGLGALPVVWIDPLDVDVALVARADGVWRSTSGGRTWERVHVAEIGDPAITTFFRAPGASGAVGALVIGTTDGVRYSLDDGASWIDIEDATDGARVFQVAAEGGWLWAATDRGLFKSPSGAGWEQVLLPTSEEVRTVVPDPSWDNGFWIGTATSLYRTDDGGQNFYVAGRQPLRGLREMVHLDEPGHLLATSDDGVWESMDGGVAWVTADRRLSEPTVRALSFTDLGPVIATPGGVWRMVVPREVARSTRKTEVLSLGQTIGIAADRAGVDLDVLSIKKAGIAARLVPQLDLYFDYDTSGRRFADYESSKTTDSFDDQWSLGFKLCFGGGCSGVDVYQETTVDYSDPLGASDGSLYAFDGEVFNEGEPVAAAANVSQRILTYRQYLSEHVADAWLARQRLVAETAAVRTLPLRDQVLHEIQIQELDARLDAMTDGAFTRSPSESRPEESR